MVASNSDKWSFLPKFGMHYAFVIFFDARTLAKCCAAISTVAVNSGAWLWLCRCTVAL
jgi:hypothetical protein